MASEYLCIGPTPYEESCQQVGTPSFDKKKEMLELEAYKQQLLRVYGDPPEGAAINIKSFPHDFGSYREVICRYNPDDEKAVEYAFAMESGCANWDAEAVAYLKDGGYYD